jgi:RNA polymerase sigma-70 factor (ECF subfamily)
VSKRMEGENETADDAPEEERDAELIAAYLGGSEEAFNRLVMRHHRTAFNLAYRFLNNYEDANDIAQEAFIRVHKSLKRFKGNCSFKTWLYKIVLNLSRNKYRWKKRRGEFAKVSLDNPSRDPESNPMDVPDEAFSVEREIRRKEIQSRIEESLSLLPAEYREILVLRHMEGLSYSEISKLLKCAEGTIKSRLHRARVEIRKLLADMVEA